MYFVVFMTIVDSCSDRSAESAFLLPLLAAVICVGDGRKCEDQWEIYRCTEIRRTYIRILIWVRESFLGYLPFASLPHWRHLHLCSSDLSFDLVDLCSTAAQLLGFQCYSLLPLSLLLGNDSTRATWIWAVDKTWADR